MSTFINYFKVVTGDNGELELKEVLLAGIAEEGIVLNAGKLNAEVSDAIQHYYYLNCLDRYNKADKAVTDYKVQDSFEPAKLRELEKYLAECEEVVTLLNDNYMTGANSTYTFVNRIALAILNDKKHRVTGEIQLYNALKISGSGDNVEVANLSKVRDNIIPVLAEMLAVKECPYLKPVNVKLNLKEVSQLIALANNTRTRWTNKGIKTKYSKTIETEVALQSILFVCRNAFKMVIPVKSGKDDREFV